MRFSEATILITGGGSGIGRALAEALSRMGARIIIAGRTLDTLARTLDADPTMVGYPLDVTCADDVARHPDLNVLINNAGVMALENLLAPIPDWADLERTVATNLLGPMRLTTALLPHFCRQSEAAVVNVTSALAFVPRADTPTYSATKAALHSWTQALRHQLRRTSVRVVELVPPLVLTNFAPGQVASPNAMPLDAFITEALDLLCATPTPEEVLVARAQPQRLAERTGRFDEVFAAINPS